MQAVGLNAIASRGIPDGRDTFSKTNWPGLCKDEPGIGFLYTRPRTMGESGWMSSIMVHCFFS